VYSLPLLPIHCRPALFISAFFSVSKLFVPGTDHHLRQLLNNFFNLFPHVSCLALIVDEPSKSQKGIKSFRHTQISNWASGFSLNNNLSHILSFFKNFFVAMILKKFFSSFFLCNCEKCALAKSNFWASSEKGISRLSLLTAI
jgi:hypothetical protein